MGRIERKRWGDNDRAMELVEESATRALTLEEIDDLKRRYTGYGGLTLSNGQFFTPSVVTNFIVDMLGLRAGSTAEILEPSCGAGAFFNALPSTCRILGVEMMHEAAKVARICYPHVEVLQKNTLEILYSLENRFDFVVGNPPFMKLKHEPQLAGFEVARFLGKAEWYFVELASRALRPGGVCAFVVPDGILSNAKDQKARKWLCESHWLRAVISLPTETFKHVGTGVKTSILVFQKKLPGVDLGNYQIFMGICKEIGWDSRGRSTEKCDLPEMLEQWLKFKDNWLQTEEEEAPPPQPEIQTKASELPPHEPQQTSVSPCHRPVKPRELTQMAFNFA